MNIFRRKQPDFNNPDNYEGKVSARFLSSLKLEKLDSAPESQVLRIIAMDSTNGVCVAHLIRQNKLLVVCLRRIGRLAEFNHCIYELKDAMGLHYIGETNNFKRRIREHMTGRGAERTKCFINPSAREVCWTRTREEARLFEDAYTQSLKELHGKDFVRGGHDQALWFFEKMWQDSAI